VSLKVNLFQVKAKSAAKDQFEVGTSDGSVQID
jgi:hypothetical protein